MKTSFLEMSSRHVDWDFDDLAKKTPLKYKIFPRGPKKIDQTIIVSMKSFLKRSSRNLKCSFVDPAQKILAKSAECGAQYPKRNESI